MPGVPDWVHILWWGELMGEKLANSEWDIQQVADWATLTKSQEIGSLFGAVNSSHLVAEFTLTRRPKFIIDNYIVQAHIFYIVSWVGLWVDLAAVPARAAIGVIPVLVTSNKMSALAASIPPISYSTRLEAFMQMTLYMIAVHMLEFGIAHFAARWHKKRSAEKEHLAWDSKPHRCYRMFDTCVEFLHNHMEVQMRWLSPVIYAVAAAAILH